MTSDVAGASDTDSRLLGLPDPERLEEARRLEVRRTWLYRLGLVVVGIALYVNLSVGLFGTALAVTSQLFWWGWAALATAVLVALPATGLLLLQRWREGHLAEERAALLRLLAIEPPSRWLRVGLLLLFAGVVGGISGVFTQYDMRLGWSLIVSLQLVGVPLRFWRLGTSWGWALHLLLWVALSIGVIHLTYPWVGEDGVMWVGIATLLASPSMLVNLFAAKRVVRAAVDTPGRGLGRLEPLLAFHHLAEVYLQRGTAEELEPWMRRIVSFRPRSSRVFVLLGHVMAARDDPRGLQYWSLGARLLPLDAEVFAQLAEAVDHLEYALAYARFAEANALRRPTGLDTERFTRLVSELAAR